MKNKLIGVLSGPFVFALSFLLPGDMFTLSAKGAVGIMLWMVAWWVYRPVDIGVTSLLPVALNSIFAFVPMDSIVACYASEVVILLFGANLITIVWTNTGLDKRIALASLCLIGPSVKQQIVLWFTFSTLLSTVLPNSIVCALLTPIAFSMLSYVGECDLENGASAILILISIAFGAGLGGFGTPLGGSMNLVAIRYLEKIIGTELMYRDWIIRMMPILILLTILNIGILLLFKTDKQSLPGSRTFFQNSYSELGNLSRGEKYGILLFGAASFLAFARPLYAEILPLLKPAYGFLCMGLLTFLIRDERGEVLLTWGEASKKLMWGLFLLFAGGLAIGEAISLSGASDGIAALLAGFSVQNGIGMIFLFVTISVLLSNFSSNTAAVAIVVPIVISLSTSLGINPIPHIFISSVACNCAYILPTSIRAIPVGYGVSPSHLLKKGLVMVLASIIAVTVIGYIFINFWQGFGAL